MPKRDPPTRKLVESRVPSGMTEAWKVWRHCMCRNGFYPLIVAPFVTAAFLLDAYSSTGCNFIHLEVGIEPVNIAWNQTDISLGLFHFEHDNAPIPTKSDSMLMHLVHPECQPYDALFQEYFITGDKTWKMTQILGLVSGCAGCIATVLIWLMIITPLPACFFWSGFLLPSVLVELLAGGAKFIFFDTQICQDKLWVSSEVDTPSTQAESCSLSKDSYIAIAACALGFCNLLLICLKAPERRELDNDYSHNYLDVFDDMDHLRADTMEDSVAMSFDKKNDVEIGRSRSNSSTYDMEAIVSRQMNESPTHIKKRSKKRNAKNYSDIETEQLRMVECSMEYNQKQHLQMIMDDESDSGSYVSRPKSVKSSKSFKSSKSNEFHKMKAMEFQKAPTTHYESQYPTSATKSKYAPSDEMNAFGFRSPLKAFKDNFSPVGSNKKMTNMREKKTYDEDKIMKCVADLEKSFSEE